MSNNAFQVRHGLRAGSTLVIDSNGNWVGNVITPTYGGVGITSYAVGDILYASGSGTLSKLVVGSNTDVLTLAGGIPTWAAPTGGSGGAAGSPRRTPLGLCRHRCAAGDGGRRRWRGRLRPWAAGRTGNLCGARPLGLCAFQYVGDRLTFRRNDEACDSVGGALSRRRLMLDC